MGFGSRMSDFWYWSPSRVLSLIVAGIYIIAAIFSGKPAIVLSMLLVFLPLPLGCIWFADELGAYEGPGRAGWWMNPTPGIFLKIIGWILLLLPVIVMAITLISSK